MPIFTILCADDDEDDRLMTREAFEESRIANDLRFVHDGVELLQYLRREGPYADPSQSPRPGLVLLDLNMPRLDGREALAQIKADPALREIPVVVMTTSDAEVDVDYVYRIGGNSYITKPVSFEGMVQAVRRLDEYWLQLVRLPGQ
ncbi:response regulator [Alkalilimnicola sp. S0819]|uniref:response regulator n=1 Tax=Alkalilimnicola sp. S0819 TaxID=2613922 RepID=UPI001261E8EE|nr:response regulator [Alkalilimnicola sp. S0819]KAB7624135.1 response regulator [Alkalilimnicola sp. S0819]MPQ16388.1 response regulator [Alkalilimnicola sp. S0819]